MSQSGSAENILFTFPPFFAALAAAGDAAQEITEDRLGKEAEWQSGRFGWRIRKGRGDLKGKKQREI